MFRPPKLALPMIAIAGLGAAAAHGHTTTPAPPPATTTPPRIDVCSDPVLRLRCPNLVMAEPRNLTFDRTTMPGRVLLRATSSIDNIGAGPLRLRARRSGRRTMSVIQVIYGHLGRRPHRGRTKARLDFTYVQGERYDEGNVGGATYWKLRGAALLELWSIDADRKAIRILRRGPKLDYCFRDLRRTQASSHSPRRAVYGACSQDPGARAVVLGTSPGWSDIYPYGYPKQWIDVTGLKGQFAFAMVADPYHQIAESNERDNISEVYIDLPSGRILGQRRGVPIP